MEVQTIPIHHSRLKPLTVIIRFTRRVAAIFKQGQFLDHTGNHPAFSGPLLSLGPLTSDRGCTASNLCFRMDVPDGCLTTGADVRDGAGMHSHTSSSTGLGQCGVMKKLSPRLSSIVWYLQLHFDKHTEPTRVGSDAEGGDSGAAAPAGRAAQHPQRLAVPLRHSTALQ